LSVRINIPYSLERTLSQAGWWIFFEGVDGEATRSTLEPVNS
jgi:hypothetical protein